MITHERLAIILELFSFFFVTTDLYGEERLKLLEEGSKKRVQKAFIDINAKKIFSIEWVINSYRRLINGIGPISTIVLGIIGLFFTLFLMNFETHILNQYLYPITDEYPVFAIVSILVALFTCIFTIMVIFVIISIVPLILILVFDTIQLLILNIAIKILQKSNIQGVGILIGTIMFIVSKALIF
jgi:hypothetical protein